jgi:hypothetical protein
MLRSFIRLDGGFCRCLSIYLLQASRALFVEFSCRRSQLVITQSAIHASHTFKHLTAPFTFNAARRRQHVACRWYKGMDGRLAMNWLSL